MPALTAAAPTRRQHKGTNARLDGAPVGALRAALDLRYCRHHHFVMLELGQPLHAFDNRAIEGEVVVRLRPQGRAPQMLNGQEVELAPTVADRRRKKRCARRDHGRGSECGFRFDRRGISRGGVVQSLRRRGPRSTLRLSSEAAFRFERGVDFAATAAPDCLLQR